MDNYSLLEELEEKCDYIGVRLEEAHYMCELNFEALYEDGSADFYEDYNKRRLEIEVAIRSIKEANKVNLQVLEMISDTLSEMEKK